jgi:hypothetical protein
MAPRYILSAVGLVSLGLAAPTFAQTAGDKKPGAAAQPKDKPAGANEKEPSAPAKPEADAAGEKSTKADAKVDDTSSPKAADRSAAETSGASRPSEAESSTKHESKEAAAPAPSNPPGDEAKVAEPPKPESAGSGDFWLLHRPKPGEIELGYFLGFLTTSNRNNFHRQTLPQQDIGTGLFFGTRIGYFPFEFAGVELEAGIAPTSTANGRAAQVWTLRGDVMAQLPLVRVVPFVVLGGGRMGVFSNTLGNDGDPLLHFGTGAKFALSEVVSARLDLRDNLTQKTSASDGSLTHGFELTLGITVRVPTQGTPAAEETATPPKAQPEAPPAAETDKAPLAMDPFDSEPGVTPRQERQPSAEPKKNPDASP